MADGELRDVPIGPLLALPTLPFRVSYPALILVQPAFHECLHYPQINYPEYSGNPPYKFHLESATESQPSGDVKPSSSSSVAKLQSSCCSSALSSSMAKLQLSRRYNSCSNDSSHPHFPGLNNWRSKRSSNWSSDSYIDGPSDDSSHPHSPGLDPGRSGKAKELAQTSTIGRQMMARSHEAAAAAAQAAKDRQFRAFQEELGLSLNNDGEALAPSIPQKAAAWRPAA